MTRCWTLDILGRFALRAPGGERAVRIGRKWQGLLAYLAIAGTTPVARDTLADLLWGEHQDRHARHSLNQALTGLRAVADGALVPLLRADSETVALDTSALAYFAAERYADAIQVLEPMATGKFYHHAWLAAAWANVGDLSRARAAAERCLELAPDFTIARFARHEPIRNSAHLARFVDGLCAAGVPK